MNAMRRGHPAFTVLLLVCSTICSAESEHSQSQQPQLTPQQIALIEKASTEEKSLVKAVQEHAPLVQTYIQHFSSDPKLGPVPDGDQYMLGRVSFGHTFTDTLYAKNAPKKRVLSGSEQFLNGLTRAFSMQYLPNGFMDMMFLDTSE